MSTQDLFVIAERYSRAVFDLAAQASLLDTIEAELSALAAMMAENAELARFIASPLVSREGKAAAFDALLVKARASDGTRRFVQVLAQNRRLEALPAIAAHYAKLMHAHRGEVVADITSANPMNDADVSALVAALGKATGRKVKASAHVNPALLGGVTVQVAGRMIDYSLQTQLTRLEKQLKKTVTA